MIIGHLRGELLEHTAGHVIVDCGGVGYQCQVSAHTSAALPPVGAEVALRVFTHVSDRSISLFGFASASERELFDLLITVKKVGPGSAIGILSAGASPSDIAQMIISEQIKALTKLKGVGKKTAEMLVVELRDKCELLLATWQRRGDIDRTFDIAPVSQRPGVLDDVTAALVQMGWKLAEVEKVVATLEIKEGAQLEAVVVEALRAMPR